MDAGLGADGVMALKGKVAAATRRGTALVLLGAALAGCAAITGGPAPRDIYTLSAPRDFGPSAKRSRAQILIAAPKAMAALDTDNIAVLSDNIAISYFAGAAWSDRVPQLFQRKIIESFENSGRVRAVGQPGEGLLIDYQIATDIRAFELAVDGGRVARVEFSAKIIDDRNGRVRASRTFRREAAAAGDSVNDAVSAMDRAADECLVDLVNWTLERI
ncbi:ABC-type transport auxiliary lipoprotein family protein [Breoghania sp.]|uniref:ABC-type transport auxiliary lipoprotein family protein n=2 Tax=Breoghania sp. TaxID=2065378 RepID=UPI002AA68B49|nr:ABC-type transport auxiliary lipoprotein family protein [Breoghania sp.]